LAVSISEPPLLWNFAAYGSDLEDVVAKRPSASSVISENLPDELKERRQWICWEWEYQEHLVSRNHREQRWSECPISPITGGGAWNTPDKWGSFSEALAFMEDHGLAGVAFVISTDDPYMVVDLTNCRDSMSGALDSIAAKIVAGLCSYSETSPNGIGVRIIARSQSKSFEVPMWEEPLEGVFYLWPWVFHQDWFFPMTGHGLPNTPPEIGYRDEELRRLQEYDNDRPGFRHPPSTASTAMIKDCQLVDQTVVVKVDPGVGVCLDARTGERIHCAITPSDSPADASSYTMDNILIEWVDFVEVPSPCVWATDTLTEDELWYFPHEDNPIFHSTKICSVSVKGGVVYLNVDIDDDLFALDARSGRVLWHFCDSRVSSFEIANGVAYVYVADGLRALDARTGKEIWHLATDGPISGSIVAGSRLYIGEHGSNIIRVDAVTGTVDDGSSVWCVDAFTGAVRWSVRTIEGGRPFAAQDRVVAVAGSSLVGAINAKTGEVLWERISNHSWSFLDWRLGAFGPATVMEGETIYVGDDDGSVMALESTTGRERWRLEIGDAVRLLQVIDDVVLVAGQHVIYALRHV
jgi:outer membrane protein assembly factor BamB